MIFVYICFTANVIFHFWLEKKVFFENVNCGTIRIWKYPKDILFDSHLDFIIQISFEVENVHTTLVQIDCPLMCLMNYIGVPADNFLKACIKQFKMIVVMPACI